MPPWVGDLKVGARYINARMETVAQRAPFRTLIGRASRRALQVADGYFEWLAPEQQRRGQPRQPFYFQLDGGAIFAFAALWTPAKVAGEWMHSVTLLTCDAAPNPVAAAIHDRMPVILADDESRQAWLDERLDAHDALALCGALPPERLTARPVSPAVNRADPEAEGPELLVAPAPAVADPRRPTSRRLTPWTCLDTIRTTICGGRLAVWPRSWRPCVPVAGLGVGPWPVGSEPAGLAGCSRPSSRCSLTGGSRCGPRTSTRPSRRWWASRCHDRRSRVRSPRTLRALRGDWSGWRGVTTCWSST